MTKEILDRIKRDAETYYSKSRILRIGYTAGAIAERPRVRAEVIEEVMDLVHQWHEDIAPAINTNTRDSLILRLEQLKLKP